jgi:hypothetical protein
MKTAIGLFENPSIANEVVGKLHTAGFPTNAVRILGEPLDMEVTDPMSTPRTDFEVSLEREFLSFGASKQEAESYVRGVRRGGVLVFASGEDKKVDSVVDLMNNHGAVEVEEFAGREPLTSTATSGSIFPGDFSAPQTGRVRQSGGGARLFVW